MKKTRDYEFANRLIRLRKERKYSQYQLAQQVGVTDKAVSKWENGVAKPTTDICMKLAKVLNVTVDELLMGEKELEAEKSIYESYDEIYGPVDQFTNEMPKLAETLWYELKKNPVTDLTVEIMMDEELDHTTDGVGHSFEVLFYKRVAASWKKNGNMYSILFETDDTSLETLGKLLNGLVENSEERFKVKEIHFQDEYLIDDRSQPEEKKLMEILLNCGEGERNALSYIDRRMVRFNGQMIRRNGVQWVLTTQYEKYSEYGKLIRYGTREKIANDMVRS